MTISRDNHDLDIPEGRPRNHYPSLLPGRTPHGSLTTNPKPRSQREEPRQLHGKGESINKYMYIHENISSGDNIHPQQYYSSAQSPPAALLSHTIIQPFTHTREGWYTSQPAGDNVMTYTCDAGVNGANWGPEPPKKPWVKFLAPRIRVRKGAGKALEAMRLS